MNIEPGDPGKVKDTRVTFDSFEEWEAFSMGLPFLHPQHFRLTATRIRQQMPYPLPIRSYHPESFPRPIDMTKSTLGAFLGEISLRDPNYRYPSEWYQSIVDRQRVIGAEISNYLGLIPKPTEVAAD